MSTSCPPLPWFRFLTKRLPQSIARPKARRLPGRFHPSLERLETRELLAGGLPGPPVANNDAYTVPSQTPEFPTTLNVTQNDTDPEGYTLTPIIVQMPQNGTASVVNNAIVYTPSTGYTGADTLTYKDFDGSQYSNVATVALTDAVPGPDFTWTGAADENWSNPNNWVDSTGLHGVPGANGTYNQANVTQPAGFNALTYGPNPNGIIYASI